MTDILSAAQKLHETRLACRETESLRTDDPFSLEEAYRIQEAGLKLRELDGERAVGVKLGFTSKAKMQQMGVNHLIWGGLTDAMQVADDGVLDLSRFIHPRIEPEIGFLTSADIDKPLTFSDCLDYIDGIFPALEIIDSRYKAFKFSLEDVVADNTSSAAFVAGPLYDVSAFEINRGVLLGENGKIVDSGSTAAILGNPLRALVQSTQLLAERGQVLPAGSLILAGAATAAAAMKPGSRYCAHIHGMGSVSVTTNGG